MLTRDLLTELLVLRAQAGRRDALELLVREWQPRLHAHALRLTGEHAGADDVAQEVWLAILRGLCSLEDAEKFGPWAYRIVTIASAAWIRRRSRLREHERAIHAEAAAVQVQDVEHDAVRAALQRLPAEEQCLLHLRYVEDFRIEQIAEALAIAPGTAKSRLFHARNHLREILERSESRGR